MLDTTVCDISVTQWYFPGTPVSSNRTERYNITLAIITCIHHCRQRAPIENVPSASGTSHFGIIDIQAMTKSKYHDHIALLYLESRRCLYRSIIFVCVYLYVYVVNFIDYSDMDKMMT